MITKRDQDIINFLDDFHIATSEQIHKLFFPGIAVRSRNARLKYLLDTGFIKMTRSTIDNSYAYYVGKKPYQIHHDLIRTELYTHLKGKYNVLEWHNEYTIGNIRSDAYCYIRHNGIPYPVFVEIHLHNKFNFDKYKILCDTMDLKAVFSIVPRVIICTDRSITIPNMPIKFKVVDIEMKDLDSIFELALLHANTSTRGRANAQQKTYG